MRIDQSVMRAHTLPSNQQQYDVTSSFQSERRFPVMGNQVSHLHTDTRMIQSIDSSTHRMNVYSLFSVRTKRTHNSLSNHYTLLVCSVLFEFSIGKSQTDRDSCSTCLNEMFACNPMKTTRCVIDVDWMSYSNGTNDESKIEVSSLRKSNLMDEIVHEKLYKTNAKVQSNECHSFGTRAKCDKSEPKNMKRKK